MIARRIYRLLLFLHPPLFRERFAHEMLWIFDQTAKEESISRLFADAALSLLKQHTAMDAAPRDTGRLFQETHTESLPAIRFLQAGAVVLPLFIGFLSLVHESVPLPEPPKSFAIRRYSPDLCGDFVLAARTPERSHKLRFTSALRRSRP
ncbi:hypothetical protein BH10ACI4_BH10ACI4_38150 [soil metagenome]